MITRGLDHDTLLFLIAKNFEADLRANIEEVLRPIVAEVVDKAVEDAVAGIKVRLLAYLRPEHLDEVNLKVILEDRREG